MNVMQELERLIAEERLAHGYVIDGDPLGEGKRFALEFVLRVMGHGYPAKAAALRHRLEGRIHPDVLWVEPKGKLRQIKVEEVDQALKLIHEKSFEGGWKAVVFLGAERMNAASGNKLLKSLEEPPPKTLLLLVTPSPEQLLATLRSRCQFLSAPKSRLEEAAWLPALLELLRQGPPRNLRQRLLRAALFRDFLNTAAQDYLAALDAESPAAVEETDENLDEKVEDARETTARRQMQRAIMAAVEAWYRDVLALKCGAGREQLCYPAEATALQAQAEGLAIKSISKIMENLREAAYRLEGNLPVQVVLEGAVF